MKLDSLVMHLKKIIEKVKIGLKTTLLTIQKNISLSTDKYLHTEIINECSIVVTAIAPNKNFSTKELL